MAYYLFAIAQEHPLWEAAARIFSKARLLGGVIFTGLLAAVLAALVELEQLHTIIWLPLLAVIAQLAVDTLRLPSSAVGIDAISRGKTGLYAAMVISATIVLGGVGAVIIPFWPTMSLYACQAIYAYAIIVIWFVGSADRSRQVSPIT